MEKLIWMRETRMRLLMQVEISICRDEVDWQMRCQNHAVNN